MAKHASPRVGVVAGGPSVEHEVSRVSGKAVAEALRASFESVTLFELNRETGSALRDLEIDVVFPALHGPPGEDGTFQGFLEILGLPYVGSGVRASACAMDKSLAKQLFKSYGLPIADDVVVTRSEDLSAALSRIERTLGFDIVVKPSGQGSALGVQFANDRASAESALKDARAIDENVLIERRIVGREVTVGILERNAIEAFPAIEIRTPENTWYDYHHRYTVGESEHIIPAPLPDWQYTRVLELGKLAHAILGCRDLSRADFVVPEVGEPILLEVNTLPGMTPTSLYPDGARAHGLTFDELTKILVLRAWHRKGENR